MSESGVISRTILVDGRPVFCRVLECGAAWAGEARGEPLLLLHGLGCSSDAWSTALSAFQEAGMGRLVVAPDMPGYGKSEGPPRALGIEQLADWTACLMDRLGVHRAHIAAHSMGCQVALAFAHRHPRRAGSLILIGPTLGRDIVPAWRYVIGLLADTFLEKMLYNGTLARMMCEMGMARYLATTRLMFADHPLSYAREIDVPVGVVRGERDAIVPDSSARRLAAALPRGSFRRVAGCAHAVQFNRPQLFAAMVSSFLATAEREDLETPECVPVHRSSSEEPRTDLRLSA